MQRLLRVGCTAESPEFKLSATKALSANRGQRLCGSKKEKNEIFC